MQSVLSALQPRHALFALAALGCALVPTLLSAGCGPEAIGIEACRKIEAARCEAAASCGFSKEDIADCKLIYQDQCLHGMENTAHRPTDTEADACVAAVQATGACAASGVTKMSDCPAAPLSDDAGPAADNLAPCDVVLSQAHELEACAFAIEQPDGGTGTTTTSSDTTSDAGTD